MANLKDLIVNGASRFIGKIFVSKGAHMSGPLTWQDADALPVATSNSYLLTIDPFADGGTTKYITTANASVGKLATARTIDGVSFNGSANIIHYGSCSTAAGTAAKTVACTGFSLATGAWIAVKFTATNSAANPTLNVQSTGAKAIYYRGAAITAGYLAANRTYLFVYNGSQFELIGDINTDANTTYTAQTTTVGSASAGTAIAADDITSWSAGTAPSLSYTARTIGSASGWSAGTAASASASKGVVTFTNGAVPSLTVTNTNVDDITSWSAGTVSSLSYTARSIPNISVTNTTVMTGITAAN